MLASSITLFPIRLRSFIFSQSALCARKSVYSVKKTMLIIYNISPQNTRNGNGHFLAYIPSWWKNLPRLAGKGVGLRYHPPFTISTITCKVVVHAPAERAETPPYFYSTPICTPLPIRLLYLRMYGLRMPNEYTYTVVQLKQPSFPSTVNVSRETYILSSLSRDHKPFVWSDVTSL